MAGTLNISSLKKLSVAEKLKLIESIWSLIDEDAEIPIDPKVMAEMDRRLKRARRKPDEGMTLEEFEAKVRSRG
ncbi:MAG: addiction module protein [Planctomycetes bacterium]|jgi:putative addiction module component (TIGR02574 family)|nr:addiction module protein [Planctomycetota bacterium]